MVCCQKGWWLISLLLANNLFIVNLNLLIISRALAFLHRCLGWLYFILFNWLPLLWLRLHQMLIDFLLKRHMQIYFYSSKFRFGVAVLLIMDLKGLNVITHWRFRQNSVVLFLMNGRESDVLQEIVVIILHLNVWILNVKWSQTCFCCPVIIHEVFNINN